MTIRNAHDNSPTHRGVIDFLARTGRFLLAWWRADRVRASPREGRLLRLQPLGILRIGINYVQVCRRCNGQTQAGPYVSYDCLVDGRSAKLLVKLCSESHQQVIEWSIEGCKVSVDADDIEVFS